MDLNDGSEDGIPVASCACSRAGYDPLQRGLVFALFAMRSPFPEMRQRGQMLLRRPGSARRTKSNISIAVSISSADSARIPLPCAIGGSPQAPSCDGIPRKPCQKRVEEMMVAISHVNPLRNEQKQFRHARSRGSSFAQEASARSSIAMPSDTRRWSERAMQVFDKLPPDCHIPPFSTAIQFSRSAQREIPRRVESGSRRPSWLRKLNIRKALGSRTSDYPLHWARLSTRPNRTTPSCCFHWARFTLTHGVDAS